MGSQDRYIKKESSLGGNTKRSRFPLDHTVKSSYLHGYLYPVGAPIEVLPGDTFKCDIAHLTRMSTPIFPIMDNIYQHYAAFFVPKRIIFNKTKQFYGEAEDMGIATEISEPCSTNSSLSICRSHVGLTSDQINASIGAMFGLVTDQEIGEGMNAINVLPVRAFLAVYNEHFRDQNFCNKYLWDKDQYGPGVNYFASCNGVNIDGYSLLPKVKKNNDLFVSSLPWAQKGDPVLIPSLGDVPVDGSISIEEDGVLHFYNQSDTNKNPISLKNDAAVFPGGTFDLYGKIDGSGDPIASDSFKYLDGLKAGAGELVGNLYHANEATINDLRFACAYQLYLEKLGHFGSRYGEQIKALFGVNISDTSAQIPEFLGHMSTRINVDQVLQTTGHVAGSTSTLGQLGANSVTGTQKHLFVKSFDEPGYVVIVTYFKHDRTYAQGVDPIFMKYHLLEYYQPPFANLGDQPLSKSRLYWTGKNVITNFGFNEPWSEYRSIQDRCYGLLDPSMPNSLDFMTLSEKYASAPVLGKDFVEEDRDNIARALTTGVNGPDYICDTLVKLDATRVMPLWANDHIGVL